MSSQRWWTVSSVIPPTQRANMNTVVGVVGEFQGYEMKARIVKIVRNPILQEWN